MTRNASGRRGPRGWNRPRAARRRGAAAAGWRRAPPECPAAPRGWTRKSPHRCKSNPRARPTPATGRTCGRPGFDPPGWYAVQNPRSSRRNRRRAWSEILQSRLSFDTDRVLEPIPDRIQPCHGVFRSAPIWMELPREHLVPNVNQVPRRVSGCARRVPPVRFNSSRLRFRMSVSTRSTICLTGSRQAGGAPFGFEVCSIKSFKLEK